MNDEHTPPLHPRPSLDARFAARPHTAARLHRLADLMDAALARGATADEAEEIALVQLRTLGADLLTDWARAQHDASLAAARVAHPAASLDAKKN